MLLHVLSFCDISLILIVDIFQDLDLFANNYQSTKIKNWQIFNTDVYKHVYSNHSDFFNLALAKHLQGLHLSIRRHLPRDRVFVFRHFNESFSLFSPVCNWFHFVWVQSYQRIRFFNLRSYKIKKVFSSYLYRFD
jgi:hypothetical protein